MMTFLLILIAIIALRAVSQEVKARRSSSYRARRLEGSIEANRAHAADERRRDDAWRASWRAGMPL